MGIIIQDIQAYIPKKQVTNHYFEEFLDTSDEWIRKRTGIQSRYFSDESVSEMAVLCAKPLLQRSGGNTVSLIISASFTDTQRMPSVSAAVANACQLFGKVRVFDINVACSGFAAALDLADALLSLGEKALIIGSEQISSFLDMTDRGTSILFGDGAGAVLVEKTADDSPATFGLVEDKGYLSLNPEQKIQMDGREVFKFAVSSLKKIIPEMIERCGEPDYIVCHQANERILDHVSHALGIDSSKFYKNVAEVGNTSAASIPLCLDNMRREKCFQNKSGLLLCGFGAGLTYYSKYVEIQCNDEIESITGN